MTNNIIQAHIYHDCLDVIPCPTRATGQQGNKGNMGNMGNRATGLQGNRATRLHGQHDYMAKELQGYRAKG